MTMFIIQSAFLLAIAFILGCLLHWFFGSAAGANSSRPAPVMVSSPVAANVQPAKPVTLVSGAKTTSLAGDVPVEVPVVAKRKTEKPAAPKMAKPVAGKKQCGSPARDDLKLIVGVGRTNEAALNAMGIFTFAEIAAWTPALQKEIGEKLAFPGRIERELWVKQAASLMDGKNPIAKRAFKGRKKKLRSCTPASRPSREPLPAWLRPMQ